MMDNDLLFVSAKSPFATLQNTAILTPEELELRSLNDEPFIVSNVPTEHAYIVAPEINWLLASRETPAQCAKEAEILYQSRMLQAENMQSEKTCDVANSLFVLGSGKSAEDFCLLANQNGFEAALLAPSDVASVGGHLGAFAVHFANDSVRNYAQGVLFVDIPALQLYRGIESAGDFDDAHALLSTLNARLGAYTYRETLRFDSTYCQYENRREKCCAACADACPTFGIYADDASKQLHFSAIDCVQCGACVALCPTGAIDFKESPTELLLRHVRLFAGFFVLLIDEPSLADLLPHAPALPPSVLPFVVPELNALNAPALLGCVQESGASVALYKPNASDVLQSAVAMTNAIVARAYADSVGVVLMQNREEWNRLDSLATIADAKYLYTPRANEHTRKSFAERLRFVVKDRDLGVLPIEPTLRYAQITLKEGCTLCLSCVGACNVGALIANEQYFTLSFNPSLCTTCGYCALSCPENVMNIEESGIALNAQWFVPHVLAQDSPFCCVECGKPFATARSVQKVRDMLAANFAGDARKLRSLECCPDCKVKVMLNASVGESHA